MTDLTTLLHIAEPSGVAARWNFPAALGTTPEAPGGLGTGVAITYSFMQGLPAYEAAVDHPGFLAFDTAMQAAAQRALSAWAAVADIAFTEVPDAGAGGDIRLGRQDVVSGGYAWYPDFGFTLGPGRVIEAVAPWERGGDVWLSAAPRLDLQEDGGYGRYALAHEIGHALGLKHPFEGTAAVPAGQISFLSTIMAYDPPSNFGVVTVEGDPQSYKWMASTLYPAGPMRDDIAALQLLYGANLATNAGDTRYAWAPGERFLQTIWDAGGTDTIDAGNQVLPCVIDLRAGYGSSIGLRLTEAERRAELPAWAVAAPTPSYDGRGNLTIAWGTTIENAAGGAGNDLLIGNEAGNLLAGGAGDDTIIGGGGADVAVLPGTQTGTQLLQRADGSWEAFGPGGHDILQQVGTILFEDGPLVVMPPDLLA